jgi:hypothetical protein
VLWKVGLRDDHTAWRLDHAASVLAYNCSLALAHWGELMSLYKKRVFAVLAAMVVCSATAFAWQASEGGSASRSIRVNVVVATADGRCVMDLQQQDFTIFDNNSIQPITSFKAVIIGMQPAKLPRLVYVAGNGANRRCYEQGELFQYELTFNVPDNALPNGYHRVEVKVDKPKLIVQTRDGYYAQP